MELKDVTLREATQMPGRDYTAGQRIAAGDALDRLGVSYLQAGFPVTGETDVRVTETLAGRTDATVAALARPIEGDIEAALETGAGVVDLFAPLADAHLEHSLGTSREAVLSMLADAHDRVVEAGATPHCSLVDAFRTDREHVVAFIEQFSAVENVTLADTVGCRTPGEVRSFLDRLATAGVDLGRIGVHFHDDLGVATANVLAAATAGVGVADVSVASLGERAGNPALEEVVVAAVTAGDDPFGVDHTVLVPACLDVLDALEESVPPRKAVLGEAVTTHESGIHTEAMLEAPSTFEPFDPGTFGGQRTLVFGTGTGRSGAAKLLERAGVDGDPDEFVALLQREGPLEYEAAVELAREHFG